jgi:hypothetical protein
MTSRRFKDLPRDDLVDAWATAFNVMVSNPRDPAAWGAA